MRKINCVEWAAVRPDGSVLVRNSEHDARTYVAVMGTGARLAKVRVTEIDERPCALCGGERSEDDEQCEGCEKALCLDCVKYDNEMVPLCPECVKALVDEEDCAKGGPED